MVKVLDCHYPVSLCSNLLVNSSPSFWGEKGVVLGHSAGVQGSKPLVGPTVDSAFPPPEFDQVNTRNLSVACRKLNLIHTKDHKVLT